MNTRFTTLILLVIINYSFSQDKLFLKNGNIVNGKVIEINKTVVRIKASSTNKTKKYTEKDVEKAIILTNGKEIEYTSQTVPFLGKVFLGKLYDGKVDLYITYTYVQGNGNNLGSPTGTGDTNMGGTWTMYYMKKENEDNFFDLNYDGAIFNKFHNRVSKYLSDCPSLSQKIKSKELKKNDLEEIAQIYDSCQ